MTTSGTNSRRPSTTAIQTGSAPCAACLWNCTDIMPSALCDDLSGPHGGTYAQAARAIAEMDRMSPEGTLKLRRDRVPESDEE